MDPDYNTNEDETFGLFYGVANALLITAVLLTVVACTLAVVLP